MVVKQKSVHWKEKHKQSMVNSLQKITPYKGEETSLTQSYFNPFQRSVAFLVETSHLICCVNQMTSFNMKLYTGLKRVKPSNGTS